MKFLKNILCAMCSKIDQYLGKCYDRNNEKRKGRGMKMRKSTHHLWLKKALCFMLVLTMVFSNITVVQAEERAAVTEDELVAKTNPILKSYEISDAGKLFAVTGETRFVVEATDVNIANERLAEVVKLVNAEFVEKEISTMPHAMVYAPQATAKDIFIRLADVEDITSETDSEEAYKITISEDGVVVEAASENAVMYALRTIQTMMITNDGLVYGTIVDYPDMAERRLHVDCARKYISKDWFIRQIREMSYLKMNTIQIHFSENLGFRIECETDPSIVSNKYLTKAEVREILAEAAKYGIKVIPSFDSPGHVDQILKAHPEYGQVSSSGSHYASGLDVTNPEAVAYIYSLYDEYMELFEGCTDFHIGGDEYMEFDRAPFTTQYQSVLNNYATQKWGSGYTWKDTMANYINELAAYVYSKGFKPRIFNDGIYYGESSSPQKIQMHDYIGIDFWSQMSWNRSIAKLQTFIDKGHTDIYNFNASYFYYVLRNDMPTDGREQHSFDVLNQDANIYNNWTPGKFQENTIADDHESISGAAMSIWCDNPDLCSEDVIAEDIASALRSLASKSWNTQSNSILDYEGFTELTAELGNVAGYEKGSVLPEVGEFLQDGELGKVIIKYVDEAGNSIKADGAQYGVYGDEYSITAPEIYKWIPVTEGAVTGTFGEEVQTVTIVYKKDPNPAMFDSNMETFPSVGSYQTTGDKFTLNDESRIVVVSSDFTLQNEVLLNDLKLLSGEFTETGLTDASMMIVFGTEDTAKAGDIVVRMEEPSSVSPEGYTIDIDGSAEVTATGEAGIFYGVRTIQKALLLNDGAIDDGKIVDEPAVEVRAFHIDNARKMFTKDWIMAMIKDLSYQNINEIQFHFSENEGYRLESSTLEALDGWSYPSDGYYTKEDVLDFIEECQKYHIEFIPSLDSPGHMTYVLNYLPDDWDCTSIWPSDYRAAQTFNIYEKEECREFLRSLFTEYAEFFSAAGCKHMNIGGDEFLNNFGSMTNDQYKKVIDYFNGIAARVKSYGLTPRAWNDGLMYTGYTGYELDSDIEICYWSGPAQCATIADFVANGNKVINYADVYMYFALSSWWMANANASGEKIFKEWAPGKLANSSVVGDQSVSYPYPDYVLGASYALWCDTPSYMTQENVASNLFLRTRAMAEKSWNPNTTLSYSEFQSIANELGRAPAYDGGELPESGDVLYEGEFGTIVIRYVDEEGNALKSERTIYGVLGDAYTVEPVDIYGYRFVSMDKDAEGIFSEDEITYTLTYELYTDKADLYTEIENAKEAADYVPETYVNYKAAVEAAIALLRDPAAGQAAVDEALENLLEAKEELIPLSRLDLYMEVTYPIPAAGYTSNTYSTYQSAVSAGNTVLHKDAATEEEIAAAIAAIQTAKAGLRSAEGITPTANKNAYSEPSYYGGKTYSLTNMLDGDTSTKLWIDGPQAIDDWFMFTFGSPIKLNSMTVQYPDNEDYLRGGVVEISTDSQNWTEIGSFSNSSNPTTNTFTADGALTQYVRIRLTEAIGNWTQISEVTFDYAPVSVDTTALAAAVSDAKELAEADYAASSWAVLQTAIARAEAVLAKEDVSLAEISAATNALEAAVEGLKDPSHDAPIEKPVVCEHTNTKVVEAADATCTEKGFTGNTVCEDCGAVIATGEEIPALGHDFSGEWVVVKQPTYEEEGKEERQCSRCTEKEERTIAKLEKPECKHESTKVINKKDATCTEAGYTGDTVCNACGHEVAKGEAIEALGHNWSDWKVKKAPTYDAEGEEERQCSRCNEKETRAIAKLEVPTVLPTIEDEKATSSKVSYNAVSLKWDAVENAESYKVVVYSADNAETPIATYDDIKATSFTVSGLKAKTEYTFKVYAVNRVGVSETAMEFTAKTPSKPSSSSTQTTPAAPVAPATGDTANITALVMMMLVAAYGVVEAMRRKTR